MALSYTRVSIKQLFTGLLLIMSLSGFGQEICSNGIDDDGDGLIDLNDTVDCYCSPGNAASVPSLISNPSFEAMSMCPNYFSELTYATGWKAGTNGTSDYLNSCGFMTPAATSGGLLPLPDGTGMAGELFGSDYKEYIGSCLTTPLVSGTPYKINFNIASTPMQSSGPACNSGTIFYSPVDISIYGTVNCSALPILAHGTDCPTAMDPAWVLLGSVTYTPSSSWGVASISFTPATNISAVMIGAPCSLPADYPPIVGFGFATCQPYFYYDNMILNKSAVFDAVGITPTGHYCSNNIVLTANAYTAIPPGATWQWYHNGIAIPGATGTTYSVTAGASGTGDYQVKLVGGTLCATSRKYTVTNAGPIVSVNSPTICASTSVSLTATGSSTSYTWSTGAVGNTIVVSPGTLSTYTVTGSVGNCSAQAIATVAINSNTAAISGNTIICSGQTTTLTASAGLYNVWDDGGTSTLNNYFTQSVTASPTITTTYTTYVTTGASGYYCVAPAVVTVSVITSFDVLASTSNSVICAGSSATLTASGPGTANYSWNDGGSSSLNTYASPTVIATPSITTTYILTGSLGSGSSCTSATVITVDVVPAPSVTILPASFSICAGASVTFTATAAGATTYSWNTGQTTNVIVVNPTATTVYTVTVSNGLCSAQATAEVNISPGPVITVNSPEICKGQQATITADGATTYTWSGTGTTSNQQTVSPAGTSIYTVMGADALGCLSLPVISTVTVVDVVAGFYESPEMDVYSINSSLELINTSSGATAYQWQSCGGSILTNTTITITLKDTGVCCIQLVASKGTMCYDTVTRCIRVAGESEIEIPNVFTPNHDGTNDVFKIKSSGLKTLNCIVYDRWGLKMSEWDTPEGYWDGKTKAGTAPSGTYFYILHYTDAKNISYTNKGFLTLFKD